MAGAWRAATQTETTADSAGAPPWGACAPNAAQRFVIGLARRSFLRRGLFRKPVADLVFALGRHRPLDVQFRDCAYRLHGEPNLVEYGLLLKPDYNAADIDFLLAGAPDGATFVDIGCNIGLYALPLGKAAGARGKVLAIDANPAMARRTAWNASASGLANLHVFACAVGDRNGRARLEIRKEDLAIAAVRETAGGDIAVRTLGSIFNEARLAAIHGLKIDIEGHEDKALAPWLAEAPEAMLPARIVIEHPQPDADYPACATAFAQRGYRLEGRTRNNSLYRRD